MPCGNVREHDRIATYFAPLTTGEPGAYHLTDDAAVLTPPTHKKLVITTDSVIAGVHVPTGATATQIAHKLMRRNLSDIAAMGATPWRYLLNINTSSNTEDAWFAEFAAALAEDQKRFGLTLVGGDTTSGKGPIAATMTLLGLLDAAALLRSNAKEGDIVYVSGTIGDAALGLKLLQREIKVDKVAQQFLKERYYLPEPRLALGQKLHGIANAAIDCSDGLLADAAHIATTSNVRIMIERDAVPLSPVARALLADNEPLWEAILGGGDDYELIFTAPWSARERVAKLSETLGLPITRVGSVAKGSGLALLDARGVEIPIHQAGWEH